MRSIPTVSLAGDPDEVAAAVGGACRDVGFLVVVDHGIDQEIVDEALTQSQRFFALAPERKQELADSGIEDRGWFPMGRQSLDPGSPYDLSEYVMLGRDLAPDHPQVRAGTPMYGPNPWPSGLPGWREAMAAYHRAADDLCRRILGYMARSLGLPDDQFESYADDPISTLKLAHYEPMPPVREAEQFGVGAHTDWGAISVVHPGGVGGLQVLSDGTWIDVPVVDGGLVVNVGDMVQRWTNDRYLSNVHRVVNPADRERFSLVLFFDLDYHAHIEVLEVCTSPDDPARYEPVLAGEWLMERFQASLGIG
jgi:isopenicillin N synthase-like dioxygenase